MEAEWLSRRAVSYTHLDVYKRQDYDIPANTPTLTQPSLCVSSFCVSPTRVPPDENIRSMISWAEDQGLMISHQLYCTFAMQGLERGKQFYYLQLYLPVF